MATTDKNTKSNDLTHPSFWACDNCDRVLQHGEFRFNCTECSDYDQCETCVKTVKPPHPHRLVREVAYGYVEQVECSGRDLAARIQATIKTFQIRYCMGVRDFDRNDPEKYADTYSWYTYKVIGERTVNFGHGLRRLVQPRTYLGICASNRPEWIITDFACILQSFVTVPIYHLFNDREIAFIVKNASLSIIVCDKERLPRFINLHSECSSIRHIICMDPIPKNTPKINGLSIHYMSTIERHGATKQYESTITKPDDCITIIYTSGSSGFPKGAIISENALGNNFPLYSFNFRKEEVKLCYRPLAWATDRLNCMGVFLQGGRIGFTTGNVDRLIEELNLVRPTGFSAPPTIWNKIYAEYKATLALMTADKSSTDAEMIEKDLLKKFSKLIPKRCERLGTGGAMVSPAILNFMKRCFLDCRIIESYGTTECGSISFDNIIEGDINYRVESVPEMGYTTDDKPFPRGELLVKTKTMFSEYLNNPDETNMAFTNDGYFRTGDIVELRSEYGRESKLFHIDRKKSFFKLSQGQFVSPEFLQEIYMKSPFVEQIYIHGNLLEDCVAAVIVPNKEYAQAFSIKHNLVQLDNDHPSRLFYDAIMQDLHLLAKKESLRKHEIPSKLIIDFEPFTSNNGLLTSTMKLCRHRLAAHYGDRLKNTESIEDRLKVMIEKASGNSLTMGQNTNLLSIGSDSLAAVRLSHMIQDSLGVSIPLNVLFESNMTLENLANIVKNPSQISSFPTLILPQLLKDSSQELDIKIGKKKDVESSPSTIFITGTTGFVGAFLLAELLRMYPLDCKFICLVRCDIMTNPLDRIQENMTFFQLWHETFRSRIVALRGDLAQKCFGLDEKSYRALAYQIDLIFHCGATVNFVLPYSKLYSSNVLGTVEVIRLATHGPTCIPVHYISTISVQPSEMTQAIPIDEISLNHLKSGYAQSKWVAEKLVAKANRLGLPVNIYRLGSIWGHSDTGACNPNDILTLLLAAIIKTGYYPITDFNIQLNGLPADLAAQNIISLSRIQPYVYGKTYLIDAQGEGVSFHSIIQSIENCGIELSSLSYEDWKVHLASISTRQRSFKLVTDFFTNNPFEIMASSKPLANTKEQTLIDRFYIMKLVTFILNNIVNK